MSPYLTGKYRATPKWEPRFKAGEVIYYVGGRDMNFDPDEPYIVYSCKPKTEGFIDLCIKLNAKLIWAESENFISDEEYKAENGKKSFTDYVMDGQIAEPVRPPDKFKIGDTAYFVGSPNTPNGSKFNKDRAYKLCRNSHDSKVYDILLNKLSKSGDYWHTISKDYAEKNFITEEEYKKSRPLITSTSPFVTTSYKEFNNKRINEGDIVYFTGDSAKTAGKLKPNKTYCVEFSNPITGMIRLMGDFDLYPSAYFCSEAEYERLKLINDEPSTVDNVIGKSKTDSEIRMQLFWDTKGDKINWEKPYSDKPDWLRTKIYLKNPKGAYLRFNLNKPDEHWFLNIYYHRPESKSVKDWTTGGVLIRHIEETKSLITVARKADSQWEAKELLNPARPEDYDTWD